VLLFHPPSVSFRAGNSYEFPEAGLTRPISVSP